VFNGGAKGQEVSDADDKVGFQARAGSLLGRFPHRLDPKRRITIPATFRNRMGNPTYVYVIPDLNRLDCLDIFPPAEIESRLDRLRAAALTDRRASDFVTWVGSISETLDVDSQGRIRICDSLLNRVGVKRDLVLIGAFNRIQVWSEASAPAEQEAFDKFADAARELGF
jgi:MraZ protein